MFGSPFGLSTSFRLYSGRSWTTIMANLCDIWHQPINDTLNAPASRVLALHAEMAKRLDKQKQKAATAGQRRR